MKQVVIVDDSEDLRMLVVLAIERIAPGLPVRVFSNAESCLAAMASGQVDPLLLLIDLHMPGMDGAALAAGIRRLPGPGAMVRIVMMSSTEAGADVRRACAAGVSSFVRKPGGTQDWAQLLGVVLPYWLHVDQATSAWAT